MMNSSQTFFPLKNFLCKNLFLVVPLYYLYVHSSNDNMQFHTIVALMCHWSLLTSSTFFLATVTLIKKLEKLPLTICCGILKFRSIFLILVCPLIPPLPVNHQCTQGHRIAFIRSWDEINLMLFKSWRFKSHAGRKFIRHRKPKRLSELLFSPDDL